MIEINSSQTKQLTAYKIPPRTSRLINIEQDIFHFLYVTLI